MCVELEIGRRVTRKMNYVYNFAEFLVLKLFTAGRSWHADTNHTKSSPCRPTKPAVPKGGLLLLRNFWGKCGTLYVINESFGKGKLLRYP